VVAFTIASGCVKCHLYGRLLADIRPRLRIEGELGHRAGRQVGDVDRQTMWELGELIYD
jgi:hypothetical protein